MKRILIFGLLSFSLMLSSFQFTSFLAYPEFDFANIEEPNPFTKK